MKKTAVFAAFIVLTCIVPAYASMKEIKMYKEAFPDAKVKCMTCHASAMPKTGAAGLNDYGQAIINASAHPTAGTFTQVGKAEDFKK